MSVSDSEASSPTCELLIHHTSEEGLPKCPVTLSRPRRTESCPFRRVQRGRETEETCWFGKLKSRELLFSPDSDAASFCRQVCNDNLKAPMRAPCGHSFCAGCLGDLPEVEVTSPVRKKRGAKKTKQGGKTKKCLVCPVENHHFQRSECHKDFVIEGFMEVRIHPPRGRVRVRVRVMVRVAPNAQ